MNIKKYLTGEMAEFTKLEQQIANYFISEKPAINGSELSKKLHISGSTISRFIQKIGYPNYEVFINEYKNELNAAELVLKENSHYQIHQSMLETNHNLYDNESIAILIKKMYNKKIVIAAIENTALACIDFAKRLSRFGVDIRVAKTSEEIIIESTLLKENDVFIAVSISGINNQIHKVVKRLNTRNVYTYGISTSSKNLIKDCQGASKIYLEESSLLNQRFSYLFPLVILFDNIYIQYTNQISSEEEIKRIEIVNEILENN